jgi:hypothetical protein
MKKIINGMKYDTDKAEAVADWSNHYPSNDFKSCSESLFVTTKGNWFLWGEGGAMSKYSTPHGNSVGGGEEIIALTPDEAYKWLENNDETDAIDRFFPEKVEEA